MILSIDLGTTNLKAALINKEGKFFNYISQQVDVKINGDICEINPKIYLDFVIKYIKSVNKEEIEAISISSNGPSFLSLFSPIKIIKNKIEYTSNNVRLWMDKRGKEYSQDVSNYYNTYIDGSFFLPSILEIKHNDTNTYNQTYKFLTIDGFINYFLTKQSYTVNNAKDLLKYYWDKDSLDYFKLEKSKFPSFINCGEIISNIDEEIADYLKIDRNIKVIAAGSDFYYSIIGSKVDKENILANTLGTSEGLNLCVKSPVKDNRFLCYQHPLKGYYNLSGVISNTGIALNWIREILDIDNLDFKEIYELAKKSKKHNIIFLPYLTGERAPIWNSNASATLFNLTSNSKREEIANAVIEGTIFAFKSVIEELEKLDCTIDIIHINSSKKDLDYYYQLKSDITNKKFIVFKTPSAELLGLAIQGYTSLKYYNNLKEAIHSMNFNPKYYTPNTSNYSYYQKKYNLFKNLYNSTKDLMNKSL